MSAPRERPARGDETRHTGARRPDPTTVLLLRHAATRWSDEHRRQGWMDQPLTPGGRADAQAWGREASEEFDVIVSSDLLRARETAGVIARELGLGPTTPLDGLREQDQGEWTGLTKAQIKSRWPERMRERPRWPVGGEAPEAVRGRALIALGAIATRFRGQRVLALTHSGVIRALEAAAGVWAPPVPYLEGRWIRIFRATDAGMPSLHEVGMGELTCGRGHLAGAASATSAGGQR